MKNIIKFCYLLVAIIWLPGSQRVLGSEIDKDSLCHYIHQNDTILLSRITGDNPEIFNAPINDEYNAISYAIVNNDLISAIYMFNHGADIFSPNPSGKNIKDVALDAVKNIVNSSSYETIDEIQDLSSKLRNIVYLLLWQTGNYPELQTELGEIILNYLKGFDEKHKNNADKSLSSPNNAE